MLALVCFVFLAAPLHTARAVVPVFDAPANLTLDAILADTTVIAADTSLLVTKEYKLDPLAWVFKLVIRTLRDMVIQWILTGRFEGPAFSTSFAIDIARSAENASRIFLSRLTGLNFCAGFGIPNIRNFAYDFNFSIACTLPGNVNQNYSDTILALTDDPASLSLEEHLALRELQNNKIYAYIFTLDEQQRRVAQAANAFNQEYTAGGGFLGIRDPNTGKIKTPGRYIADVLAQDVNSVFREYDLADELLEAVAAIVDTFVHKTISDGLAAVTSSSQLPSGISGQQTFQFPAPPPPPAPAPPPPPPPPPPPIPAPTLTAFCGNAGPSATIQWSAAGENASGFEVQVDNNNNWFDGFWAKFAAPSALSTAAPSGFDPAAGASAPPSAFTADASYQVRVLYLQTNRFSPQTSFTALDCTPPPPPAINL